MLQATATNINADLNKILYAAADNVRVRHQANLQSTIYTTYAVNEILGKVASAWHDGTHIWYYLDLAPNPRISVLRAWIRGDLVTDVQPQIIHTPPSSTGKGKDLNIIGYIVGGVVIAKMLKFI
jgi:hypothetical protein